MNPDLCIFAARLRDFIGFCGDDSLGALPATGLKKHLDAEFNALALVLYGLQFRHNAAYRKIAQARGAHPDHLTHWTQIPAVPTAAFKEFELTSLAPGDRTAVFHSSGTTEQKPSRHFHCADSLATYEASLWAGFAKQFQFPISNLQSASAPRDVGKLAIGDWRLAILTPPPALVPHSSLVHMFEVVRQKLGAPESAFLGHIAPDGAWTLDFDAALRALNSKPETRNPKLLLGTAFSFVHLLDFLAEKNLRLALPSGSRVMETGGYKNRSRSLPKAELHALITEYLGVSAENIICEYGMSELSSQAYDTKVSGFGFEVSSSVQSSSTPNSKPKTRNFLFPPWARVQIISPETGREVAEGETGLIRVCDLANVYSVMAVQTEDLGVRRGDGFELIGRAVAAEPRGCSLMTA